MRITKELEQIEQIGATAWGLVMEGEFRKARRTIAKIKNSRFVSESERIIAIIEAKILQRCGKQQEAKERILHGMCYLWNAPDALEILAASNPSCDTESMFYHIELLGGLATLGLFTQFTKQHIASFDVAANYVEEALCYIREVANFAQPESATLIVNTSRKLQRNEYLHRGVVNTYPFRLQESSCDDVAPTGSGAASASAI